ncbi:cytochrome P460 family protein [Edaphobacter flagellatus]|uniref:cytochrome P460 family protein n=1 Tax=Edaphobacter flagellatus TaxID=1933044 RepID=UPI0021B287FB|nr:cytochrome P460 family protein [Edaphobacter flagellatus]
MRFLLMTAVALLAMTGCDSTKPEPASINQQAALTGQLPYNPLAWKVVTSWTNKHDATMSTLYGNDAAVAYARSTAGTAYPAGSILGLVTWAERDDPHWFGGKIPSTPQSVEFVRVGETGQPEYRLYRGSPLAHTDAGADAPNRIAYITTQRAAVMP